MSARMGLMSDLCQFGKVNFKMFLTWKKVSDVNLQYFTTSLLEDGK